MDLNDVLSDKTISREPPKEESTDVKADSTDQSAATSAAVTDKVETKEETKVETETAQERDDKGRFQRTVPQEALHAERQRRQEAERKLAERETKPPPSVLEDEDAAFSARISQATAPLQEKLFRLSVKAARAGREDYDEISTAFLEAADKDPQLMKAFREADDPGEYAYAVGKQFKELAAFDGDIVKYGEKKRAEGAAETEALKTQLKAMQAELETLKSAKNKQDKVPQSLNSEQSAARGSDTFSGPKPMNSILNS